MVAITAGGLSEFASETLRLDGWRVKEVDTVMNPNTRDDGKYPARFWAVYTKLNVFNLVEYEKGAPELRWHAPAAAAAARPRATPALRALQRRAESHGRP